jgi:hypothetical protein
MKKLDLEGWIKPKRKCNVEVKVESVMRKHINGLVTNHSLAPLLKQEWMWVLNVEEIESSSKIDLKDVLWCMFIKDACRPKVLIIARLLKKGCISLVTWKNYFALHINMTEIGVGLLQDKKHTPKQVYWKYKT